MGGNETAEDPRIVNDRPADPGVSSEPLSPVSLVIPCRAEHVALCRLVVGAIAMRDGLDEDVAADLKVIVTEACNCFLAMSSATHPAPAGTGEAAPAIAGCSLRMDFDSKPGVFAISVFYPGQHGLLSWLEGCEPMSQAGLGLTILKALTSELVEQADDEGAVLRLTRTL